MKVFFSPSLKNHLAGPWNLVGVHSWHPVDGPTTDTPKDPRIIWEFTRERSAGRKSHTRIYFGKLNRHYIGEGTEVFGYAYRPSDGKLYVGAYVKGADKFPEAGVTEEYRVERIGDADCRLYAPGDTDHSPEDDLLRFTLKKW
jgi:hypothetical protein